ncbi:hypothetical protein CHS0354_012959 [Potamilus streckersoni]|uniref:Uncharacterized protein n=1 Tax=Potamilus streckersoni TaxID=2493646 RepID=A0AAE0SMG1_9BIVA|nr:hypothetical protein CHS0354_012959 [Potamilus streckersoni]
MRKTVLLIGLAGLCLAFPHLQVSERDIDGSVDIFKIKQAAKMSLDEGPDDARGCTGAHVEGIVQVKSLGPLIGRETGTKYQVDLVIITADEEAVCCSTEVEFHDSGFLYAKYCTCTS